MMIDMNYIELDNKDNMDELPIYTGSVYDVPKSLVPGIYTGTITGYLNGSEPTLMPVSVHNGHNGRTLLSGDFDLRGAIAILAPTVN